MYGHVGVVTYIFRADLPVLRAIPHSPPNSKSKNTLLQTSKSNMNIQHVVSPELKWKALPLDEEDEEDPVEVAAPHEDRGGFPRLFRWKE